MEALLLRREGALLQLDFYDLSGSCSNIHEIVSQRSAHWYVNIAEIARAHSMCGGLTIGRTHLQVQRCDRDDDVGAHMFVHRRGCAGRQYPVKCVHWDFRLPPG